MDRTSPDRWQDLATLFAEVVDRPAQERAAFLARVEDASLRAELARLLLAHDRAGAFLGELDTLRVATLIHDADDSVKPGESIGPYRVVRLLGRGGMGVVLLAHDPRLNRAVALKLLPAHQSRDDTARRRLAEEAKAASALDHPHIATIYDIGEGPDGRVYIAMAFYEGESLRERLDRGPLPVQEAVVLATQLADALAAAHAAGIVHRDVKPGNILVTRTRTAKLVDFGVAKLPSAPAVADLVGGTLAYMSPEQSRGEEVDGRADIWSLGVVLYEMLAGRRPFTGNDKADLLHAIRDVPPPPLKRFRPEVPAALVRVVERCLDKSRSGRFPNASELRDALRAVSEAHASRRQRQLVMPVVMVTLVAAIAAGIRLLAGGAAVAPPAPPGATPGTTASGLLASAPTRLAVLPFLNLGADPEDEYFADGLTDEMISRLAGVNQLRVIARSSVLPYRGTDRRIPEIAAQLGVGSVLEGGIRRAGDRIRITVQLVDATSQETIWSSGYDAQLGDVLSVQRQIAERVAEALELRLGPRDRQTLAGPRTSDPDAYLVYLRGRHFLFRRTDESLRRAVESFEDAIRRDASFAAAHASLAEAYVHLGNYGFVPAGEAYPMARQAAERAVGLAGEPPEAHTVLALLHVAERDFARAEQAFQRALTLRPSDATARHLYGFFLGIQGRTADALREVHVAHELDPLALPIVSTLARLLVYSGETAEAVDQLESAIRFEPAYPWTRFGMALVYAQLHDHDQGIQAVEQALELAPGQPRLRATLAALQALAGDAVPARRLLRELETAAGAEAYAFEIALLHGALGETDLALTRLARTQWSSETLFSLRTDPLLAPVRTDPRYATLMEGLGLQP